MNLDELLKLPKAKQNEIVNELKKAAEAGHVESMLGLAKCYYNGIMVEKDLKLTFKYYKMASDKGDLNGKYNLLYMYLVGEGTEKDFNECKKLMLELERSNDGNILYQVGTVYELGNLGSVDLQKAFELYVKSANLGNDKGQIKVGNFYAEGKLFKADWNIAVEWWTKAAEQGNEVALQMLKELIEVQTERMMSGSASNENLQKTQNVNAEENTTKPAKSVKNASKPAKTQKNTEVVVENGKYKLHFDYNKYKENTQKYIDKLNEDLQKAENGDSDAMYQVGDAYYAAEIGYRDLDKARHWFEKAVENGNYEGYVGLGRLEYFTVNYNQDINKAKEYFTMAADKGSVLARKWLARIELYYGDKEKGIKDFEEIAKKGCRTANSDLAYYYIFDNLNLEKAEFYVNQGLAENDQNIKYYQAKIFEKNDNIPKYIETLAQAAEEGAAPAQYEIGYMYYHGENLEQDYVKAFNWFNMAALKGYNLAHLLLGICYELGHGALVNDEKAFYHYDYAASRGVYQAQNNVGHYYLLGKGCEVNKEKAFQVYQRAVKGDFDTAYCNLGVCYLNGYGCEVDREKAFYYTKQGAEKGDTLAMYNLAIFYGDGIGCTADNEQSFYWYKQAAENGDVKSIHQVGYMLLNGVGCEVDTKEAVKMFENGAQMGYAESISMLGACYTQGSGVEINAEKAFYYHEKAAELGVATSMLCCALSYQAGNGVKQDYLKAAAYHISAMKNGCMIGYETFVDFILKIGISKNFYTGIAEQLEDVNHEFVWYLLGEFYCKGELVEQDYTKAYKYLSMACDKGYKEAIELRDMVFTQNGEVKNYIKTSNQKKEVIVDLSDDNVIAAKNLIDKGYSLIKFTTSNALLTYTKKGFVDRYIKAIKTTQEISDDKYKECIDIFDSYLKEEQQDHLHKEVGKLITICCATVGGKRDWQLEILKKRFGNNK